MERPPGRPRPTAATWIVLTIGVAVATVTAVAARAAHDDNEERLLRQRAREAAAVLEAAVPSIEVPLATAAALAEVVEGGDATAFERALAPQVGPAALFVSASVWPVDGTEPTIVVGEDPLLTARPAEEIRAFLDRAVAAEPMAVLDLLAEETPRLGYAVTAGAGARFLVYAEQALPVDKTAVVQPDSAFDGLDYSVHLGPDPAPDDLVFASTDDLPLDGLTAVETIPLGDTTLRVTMAPAEELGGRLLARLPLVVLATGLATAVAAAALTETLQRRRRHAETLATQNEDLLDELRGAFATLQRGLLPRTLPTVEEVDIEVRYVAGVTGTHVGGDWYDVIDTPESTVVVVGDVSGRGLDAASTMASIRHTVRTLASLGLAPDEILAQADELGERQEEGHFATAVCGAVDKARRTITFACAGHPPPLVVAGGEARWLDVPVGPPIGFGPPSPYRATTAPIPESALLLLVTDGLFERRDEATDESRERLRAAAGTAAASGGDLGAVVDRLVTAMTSGTAADDTVVVAIRWRS